MHRQRNVFPKGVGNAMAVHGLRAENTNSSVVFIGEGWVLEDKARHLM